MLWIFYFWIKRFYHAMVVIKLWSNFAKTKKIVPNKKWGHRAKLIFHWKNYKHPQRTSQLVLLNLYKKIYVFLQNFIGIWAVSCITEKSITFEMKEIFSSNLLIEIDPSCKKLIWILSRCELIIFLEKYWYISGQIVYQNLSGADELGSEILRQQNILFAFYLL